MWTFQEVTPPLRLSARCLPSPTSLKAFLSSKGSASSHQQRFGVCVGFFIFPLIRPRSSTSSNTKSTLGPRVLPKLPQKGQFFFPHQEAAAVGSVAKKPFAVFCSGAAQNRYHTSPVCGQVQPASRGLPQVAAGNRRPAEDARGGQASAGGLAPQTAAVGTPSQAGRTSSKAAALRPPPEAPAGRPPAQTPPQGPASEASPGRHPPQTRNGGIGPQAASGGHVAEAPDAAAASASDSSSTSTAASRLAVAESTSNHSNAPPASC